MTHESNRERHMQRCCEHCNRVDSVLHYHEFHDEYWCDSCLTDEAEAAYDRQQERDLESPLETMREEQLRTWDEHQKAHKR